MSCTVAGFSAEHEHKTTLLLLLCIYQLDEYSSDVCRVQHAFLGSCPENLKSCAIKCIPLILIPISVAVPGVNLHLYVKVFALFDLHMEEEHVKRSRKEKAYT